METLNNQPLSDQQKAERLQLKSKLGFGDIAKIARIAKLNRKTISAFLEGKTDNEEAASAIILFLKGKIDKRKLIETEIASALKQCE